MSRCQINELIWDKCYRVNSQPSNFTGHSPIAKVGQDADE